jgi:hypothetical protein
MGFPDFGLPEYLLGIVRIIATIGGAVVGWFLCDPLTRLTYRLLYHAAAPGALLFVMKGIGATTLALLMYFMPFGGGGGGLGWGPGMGGLPGKGPGQGGDKIVPIAKDAKTAQEEKKSDDAKSSQALQPIDIEIISGTRFQDDGKDRYFLVDHKDPALSREELDDYLKRNHAKIEVTPVLTKESLGVGRDNSPLSQLLALTKKHAVKTLTTKTP